MSYMHIDNLYKNKDILFFRECYAMEKIHGTSAHIKWKDDHLTFFSGGCEHLSFISLFDQYELEEKFIAFNRPEVTIYGEAYRDYRAHRFSAKRAQSFQQSPSHYYN